MSRNYEVQVEIFPCCNADEKNFISEVLQKWGLETDADTASFDNQDQDGWSYWGNIQLTCGQSEEDNHEHLRALLPDRSITTRWRYLDDQPWDDVISTEPLKPAA